MTTPDTPDYMPPHADTSTTQVLSGNALVPITVPVDFGPLDMSPWNTLVIVTTQARATPPTLMQAGVLWSFEGIDMGADLIGFAGPTLTQGGDGDTVIMVPCKGDTASVIFDSDNDTDTAVISLLGTTRAVEQLTIAPALKMETLIDFHADAVSVPGSTNQQLGFAGPFGQGCHLAFTAPTTCFLTLYAYVLVGSTWTPLAVGSVQGVTSEYAVLDLHVPGVVFAVNVNNTVAGAATVSVRVKDLN